MRSIELWHFEWPQRTPNPLFLGHQQRSPTQGTRPKRFHIFGNPLPMPIYRFIMVMVDIKGRGMPLGSNVPVTEARGRGTNTLSLFCPCSPTELPPFCSPGLAIFTIQAAALTTDRTAVLYDSSTHSLYMRISGSQRCSDENLTFSTPSNCEGSHDKRWSFHDYTQRYVIEYTQ